MMMISPLIPAKFGGTILVSDSYSDSVHVESIKNVGLYILINQ